MTAQFDHASISVDDIDAAAQFYTDVLGFEQVQRPAFDFPGAWFIVGSTPVHLTTGGTTRGADAPLRPNDPHLAFTVSGDLDLFLGRLRANGVEVYELTDPPAASRQTFIKDPWGNVLEFCVYPARPDALEP